MALKIVSNGPNDNYLFVQISFDPEYTFFWPKIHDAAWSR